MTARAATLFFVCVALLAAPACKKRESAPAGGPAHRQIAVIPKGTTHEFWKSVHAGAVKASRELGVDIVWKGPVREDDRAEQVRVVEDFISRHVDGIVLAPLDDTALVPPAKEAESEKIPVVIIDSDIKWTGRVSFVATNNEQAGAAAARHLGKLLGGKGSVLVLRYQEGSASTMAREKGFLETFAKEFPDAKVVSDNQYGGATTESAYKTSESLLVKLPDVDGVFCPNESTTFGMLRALQDGKRAGKVRFVGFDASEKLVQALGSGEIDGLVVQDPFAMGERSIAALVAHLDGKPVDPRVDTGVTIATKENMADPKIRALLTPDLRRMAALTEHATLLAMRGVTKRFGNVQALSEVDFSVDAGEVHALLGENGAGKSTLMKILAGAVVPDSGATTFASAPYRPSGPRGALARGIAMIYQETSLAPHLTIAENVVLGREPHLFGVVKRRAAREIARAAVERLGHHDLSPERLVGTLGPGERQLVEIARALSQNARLLVMDEPTSSLSRDDAERLFEVVAYLAKSGVAVVYISHFLEEIVRVADRYTVLRDGKNVATGAARTATPRELSELMVGRALGNLFVREPRAPGDVVLEVKALSGKVLPASASFTLHRGEVLGIAGLVGAGQTELLRALFGLDAMRSGTVKLRAGEDTGAAPWTRIAQGVGLLSGDRAHEGLALAMSIAENVTLSHLGRLSRRGLVDRGEQEARAARWIAALGIRCPGPDARAGALSGGGQQKVALARLLDQGLDVLLLDEPTRGIDVGSRAEIYRLVDALSRQGKAIVVVSSHLPELLGLSDRIAVMHRGRLSSPKDAASFTEASLLEATTSGGYS